MVTVLLSLPSKKMFTYSTVLITVVFCRFKLRPTLSLLFLTHFISSVMSSLFLSTTVVSSVCVIVFIFHVTFPTPVTISPTLPVCILYSLYRLNRPGDKMQPCLTIFLDWEPFFCAVGNLHLASYCVCRSCINNFKCLGIPALLMLFHIFKYCTLSKSFV